MTAKTLEAGNALAWLGSLARQHGQELRGYLARYAQSSADIDDWMQEALLRVCAAGLDRQLDCPKAYLFRAARNIALNRIEHRKVRVAARLDIEMLDRARAETPPVHVVAQTDAEVLRLRQVIEKLPARCREVFVLGKLHGFSQKEISGILGISVSTIEKHLSKGLRLCRTMLAGDAAADTTAGNIEGAGTPARRVAR